MKVIELTDTCDAGGDLTITSTILARGYIEAIHMDYVDGATGADSVFTCTMDGISVPVMTKANLGTADAIYQPRSPCNAVADGVAFTNWADKIFVSGFMKVVISAGGVSKDFRFLVYLSDL